jgi:hypothetical protein
MSDEIATKDQKVVFAISHEGTGDGIPLVLLGVPRAAWVYMRDGKTHTFDLTKAGLPIKIMMFGGNDQGEIKRLLAGPLERGQGRDLTDAVDFKIDDPESDDGKKH